tara:strand:+ start:637 stop:1170 length:534 start_codon:yes stop_codon:yes gene_type:complete
MNYLYYGNGNASFEGNASGIEIKYKGAIEIYPKISNGNALVAGKSTIGIITFDNKLNNLFDYNGTLQILSASIYYKGKTSKCIVKRVLDYSEFLYTNAEDMTNLSENLNSEYTKSRKVSKTIIVDGVQRSLHTSITKEKLFLNGKGYKGFYHIHSNGKIMTGSMHTKFSKDLTTGNQ